MGLSRSVFRGLDQEVSSQFLAVGSGFVCEIIQDGIGNSSEGKPAIALHRMVYLGARTRTMRCSPRGAHNMYTGVQRGFHSGMAAASIAAKIILKILSVPPWLRMMCDMVLPL